MRGNELTNSACVSTGKRYIGFTPRGNKGKGPGVVGKSASLGGGDDPTSGTPRKLGVPIFDLAAS